MENQKKNEAEKAARSFFECVQALGNRLEKCLEVPIFILSIGMFVIVMLGVLSRYVVRSPFSWTEELSRYLMIWMALMSVALGIWRHEHIGVSMFVKFLPRLLAKTIICVSNFLILYFLYVLLVYGTKMAIGGKTQYSTALGTSMYGWLLAVPVSAFFCMVLLVGKMLLDIRRRDLDEILMSEDIVDTVKREEGLDF